MVGHGILSEDAKQFTKLDVIDYAGQLNESDRNAIRFILQNYGTMDTETLMRKVYIEYPFYAINSERKDLLTDTELKIVENAIPRNNETVLYTIGYEGKSLEKYLKELCEYDVKMLVDVRKNPLSMKYGFSKSQLKKFCERLHIQYVHFPELGIRSDLRQGLNDQSDYDTLFDFYRNTTLKETNATQENILKLLVEHKRIALTCFEANSNMCHRKHLAQSVASLPQFDFKVHHL